MTGRSRSGTRRREPASGRAAANAGGALEGGLFLIKYGEIALKKRNRGAFVKSLKESIRARLPGVSFSVYETWHRVYVSYRIADGEQISEALRRTFGVVSFCKALRVPREMSAIEDAASGWQRVFLPPNGARGSRRK